MKTIFLAILTTLVITGCSTLVPHVNEYSLNTSQSSTQYSTTITSSKTLQYQRIKAPASLSSKAILYTKNDYEIGNYLYSSWSDTPASMIEISTLGILQESHLFAKVIPSYSHSNADYLLESNLNAFYHRILDNGTSEGFVDITYRLIDVKSRQCLESKHFVITQPSDTQDSKGGIKALKKSIEILNTQTIQWLNTTIEMKKL
jgi:ABC-type uncharacterized transport system auxiliary subunit